MLNDRKKVRQITRFLTGECSPSEQQLIVGLIQSDKQYSDIYYSLRQIWENRIFQVSPDTYDTATAWSKVNKHIEKKQLIIVEKQFLRRITPVGWLKYAASVAALFLISFSVFQLVHENKSTLKSIASGNATSSNVALADGSHIILNNASTVKFPEIFGSNKREVYFWGEAFFEIAPDPTRPFIIEAEDARIKVLGTSFNVKALPDNGITEVVVNTGTVLFYYVYKKDNILGQVVLHKGDKGIYNRKYHKLDKVLNDDLNFLSWKTGILVFNETPLDNVLNVVGKKYGVNFRKENPDLGQLKLTATFDNESLGSVLEVLTLVHKLHFTHNGTDYLVKK